MEAGKKERTGKGSAAYFFSSIGTMSRKNSKIGKLTEKFNVG